MNPLKKIPQFDVNYEEHLERITSRRNAFRKAGTLGLGVALASMPAVFGAMTRPAYAQNNNDLSVEDVLRFALLLEYLEWQFFARGTRAHVTDEYGVTDVFTKICKEELAHVRLLEDALGFSRNQFMPEFDFTAGGQFDPFNNAAQFVILSQGFEDTGVRAYKGGVPALMVDGDVLTVAARIHSVEARHASVVRRIVRDVGLAPDQKGWITLDGVNSPQVLRDVGVYDGEDNTVTAGVDLSEAIDAYDDEAITEAYDKPLSVDEVLAIAGPFIVEQNLV